MITQEILIPPEPPTTTTICAEPLGPCIKCGEPATLKAPSGTLYCSKHGYCARRTCLRSVEKFVWYERMERYVCPCVVAFEERSIEKSKGIARNGIDVPHSSARNGLSEMRR